MTLASAKYAPLVREAVAHYWKTLARQSAKQKAGDADRGGRAAVTGGKQMDGFCRVVKTVLADSGLQDADIFLNKKLELPGYFRPTKSWDLLVVSRGRLVAAMEFKSQAAPSFGKNFNNRTEEAIGNATDLWTACREGAFGKDSLRPWLGWVMLLEECPESTSPVGVAEPHFKVFPEFRDTSYAKRYEILLQKLIRERLYDSAAFLIATKVGGPKGEFTEPSNDLTMKAFLAGLAGHVGVHVASR
ncbi:MAG: restriction endonuclease [Deltaproteobacteria bacterium]|nr:restriction endonuclease [Deltaproteobacteria bacterium]